MKLIQDSLLRFGLALVFILIFGACSSIAPSQNIVHVTPAVPTVQTATTDKQTLELFTTWGPGSDMDALYALEEIHQRQNPNITFVHNDNGGSGAGTDEYLLDRIRDEKPPDSMVIHAGKESLDYVNRGHLEPITKIFNQEGFDKVMPPLLLEQITIKGEIYTVPLNIHRSNLLWYRPSVFQANNIQPPRTFDEFFAVAEQLKGKGIVPLAIGGNFELGELFECVLAATYGPEDYVRLVNGDAAMWADTRLTTAIHTFKRMLDYTNADRTTEGWYGAAQRVLDGKAGMTIMGDWVNGDYKSQNAKANVDFAWVPAPGTEDTFMWLSDSFALPKGAPHRDAVLVFLKTAGSRAGQDAFNPIKGAIPARTDADKNLYDEYQHWSIDQFRTTKLAPSIVHGAAVPDAFRSAYSRAVIDFSSDQNEQALLEALRAAVVELTQ